MNEKIVESIIQMVQTGGLTAIWIYAIYVLGAVLKFAIGFGCLFMGIHHICANVKKVAN